MSIPGSATSKSSAKDMAGDTESANSLVERGAGKNKRKWTDDEDEKLVEALMELVNTGNFKADNGFKTGYLTFLENSLQTKLPRAGTKGRPHIESRMRTLKKDFTAVYDIRYGTNSSGFGWNSEEHIVTAPRDVWVQYLKNQQQQDLSDTSPDVKTSGGANAEGSKLKVTFGSSTVRSTSMKIKQVSQELKQLTSFSERPRKQYTSMKIKQVSQELKQLTSFSERPRKQYTPVAVHALTGLKFISKTDGGSSWAMVAKKFDELTDPTDGLLPRALF